MEDVADSLKDAGDTQEEMGMIDSSDEDRKYYPSLHLSGNELDGVEVGTKVQVFAEGVVTSRHEDEHYRSGGIEIKKVLVVPEKMTEMNNDDEEE